MPPSPTCFRGKSAIPASFLVPQPFPTLRRDGEEEGRGREAGGEEVSNRFTASNEPSIGSGRRVRTSTCRYRRPLRSARLACGKKGPCLLCPGKKRGRVSRAAAGGNAAVARAHPGEARSPPAFSYRNLFQPSVAMAKKKAAAAKPAAK
eukprot:gene2931-1984_t